MRTVASIAPLSMRSPNLPKLRVRPLVSNNEDLNSPKQSYLSIYLLTLSIYASKLPRALR